MSEIQPLSPAYPVIKPVRIRKDENSRKKPPQEKKPPSNEQEPQPLQHIDEVV